MKPTIAIVSLYDEIRESYWMLPGYVEGLKQAGAEAVVLPYTEDIVVLKRWVDIFDGFLFPGGHDISPELYGMEPTDECGTICGQRDGMERLFFPIALQSEKPILGICRGIQLFNAMLGGTLYQDIPRECPSEVEHHEQPPYHKPAHTVNIMESSILHKITGMTEMWVNSYHHQGIKKLGERLEAIAAAPDEMVEAVCVKEHPFALAVQWHPEFSYLTDENSRKIFQAFVQACTLAN